MDRMYAAILFLMLIGAVIYSEELLRLVYAMAS
jgi:hypothetical protein